MVELVLLACLIKDPQHCETFRIPFAQEMQTAAVRVAVADAGRACGLGNHPDWVVRRVSCEMPEA